MSFAMNLLSLVLLVAMCQCFWIDQTEKHKIPKFGLALPWEDGKHRWLFSFVQNNAVETKLIRCFSELA